MTIREIGLFRHRFCRRRKVRFWGHESGVTPVLIPVAFGDGKRRMWIEPAASRPHYYVFSGDSEWSLENYGPNPFCDYLEQVYQQIEERFGNSDDEREEGETRRQWERRTNWPALNTGCGMAWGELK